MFNEGILKHRVAFMKSHIYMYVCIICVFIYNNVELHIILDNKVLDAGERDMGWMSEGMKGQRCVWSTWTEVTWRKEEVVLPERTWEILASGS